MQPDSNDPKRPRSDPGDGHEARDINFKLVVITGVLHAAALAATLALMFGLFRYFDVRSEMAQPRMARPEFQVKEEVPGPRLQTSPRLDMARFRAKETAELNRYAWVNRKTGIAQIPIERAMELLAQEGAFPVRGQPQEPLPTRSSLEMIRERARESSSFEETSP